MSDEKPAEGWGYVRPGDRKAHYYRGTASICWRVMTYTGPLEPNDKPAPTDCAACRKLLALEAKAAQA